MNLRSTGIGPIKRPELTPEPLETNPTLTAKSTRAVCFDDEVGYVDTPVYWRLDLAPGSTFSGPAIVEEFGSTVPVHPGFAARVDEYRNLIVTREGAVA